MFCLFALAEISWRAPQTKDQSTVAQGTSVPWRVACELLSLMGSHTMPARTTNNLKYFARSIVPEANYPTGDSELENTSVLYIIICPITASCGSSLHVHVYKNQTAADHSGRYAPGFPGRKQPQRRHAIQPVVIASNVTEKGKERRKVGRQKERQAGGRLRGAGEGGIM